MRGATHARSSSRCSHFLTFFFCGARETNPTSTYYEWQVAMETKFGALRGGCSWFWVQKSTVHHLSAQVKWNPLAVKSIKWYQGPSHQQSQNEGWQRLKNIKLGQNDTYGSIKMRMEVYWWAMHSDLESYQSFKRFSTTIIPEKNNKKECPSKRVLIGKQCLLKPNQCDRRLGNKGPKVDSHG